MKTEEREAEDRCEKEETANEEFKNTMDVDLKEDTLSEEGHENKTTHKDSGRNKAGNIAKIGKILLKILILAAAVALLVFGFRQYNEGRAVNGKNEAVMQGSVKMTEIDLNSMIEGYVTEVCVEEGMSVKAGDVMIVIDPDIVKAKVAEANAAVEQAKAGLAQARASQAAAEAVLSKAQNGARQEDIEQAKASFDYAAKMYERMQSLFEAGAISASDLDSVEAQYLSAKAIYEEAVNGSRSEDISAASAQVEQAKAAVKQYEAAVKQAEAAAGEAGVYLEKSVITAPEDGTVTALNVEKGELVSTGMALATMKTTKDTWIEVNVRETSLGLVKEGQQVCLTFPAYEGKEFHGTVTSVSQNPDFATKKATNENGSFDILSYCVKVQMDDVGEPMYAGMTVMVDFNSESGEGGTESVPEAQEERGR